MPISLREIFSWFTFFRRRAEPDHQLPDRARTTPELTARADEKKSTYALVAQKPFALLTYLGRFVPGWLKKSASPFLPEKNAVLPVADKLKARASWKDYTDANDVIATITLLETRILAEPTDQPDRPFTILQLASAPDIVGPPLTKPTLRTETRVKKYFGWFLDEKITVEEMITLIRLSMEFSQVGWHIIHDLLANGLQAEDGTHRNQTRIIMVMLDLAENSDPIKRLYNKADIPIVTKLGILLALFQLGFKQEDGKLSLYRDVNVFKSVDVVDIAGGGSSSTISDWTRESVLNTTLPIDLTALCGHIMADIASTDPVLASGSELAFFLQDFAIPETILHDILAALFVQMVTNEVSQTQIWARTCAWNAMLQLWEPASSRRVLMELSERCANLVKTVTEKMQASPRLTNFKNKWLYTVGDALLAHKTDDREVIEDINCYLNQSPALADDLFRKKVALWQSRHIGVYEAMQTYSHFFAKITDKKLRKLYERLPLVFNPGTEHKLNNADKNFLTQFVFIQASFDELLLAALVTLMIQYERVSGMIPYRFLNQNTKLTGFAEHHRYLDLVEEFPFRIVAQDATKSAGDHRNLITKILERLRTMREAPIIPLTKEERAHRDNLQGEPMERLRTRIAEVELTLEKKRPETGQLSLAPISGQLSFAPNQPGIGDLSLVGDSPCITGGEILVGNAAATKDTKNGDTENTEDGSKDQPSDEPLATSDAALGNPLIVDVPGMGIARGSAARTLVIKK